MITLTNESILEQAKTDNHGLYTATLIMSKVVTSLMEITTAKKFVVTERNKMHLYPHLSKRMEQLQEYAEQLTPADFKPTWWKHVGAIEVPWNRRGGNIHLYLLDNGLLSKSIEAVPELTYEQRSTFFLNRVFGLPIPDQRLKGRMHLHVIDVASLDGFNNMAIKRAIANEHESRGKFMTNSSMRAFSLRQLCASGGVINDHPDLAVNRPDWFARQIPKWLAS